MSTTTSVISHDVLVVGAGPAGLTAAISLARHGVSVLVVEKHRGTSPFPKATGVSTRTMELLRTWGIDQQVRAGAMPRATAALGLQHVERAGAATVPFGYPTDEQALAVSPVTPACVPQDHLEPVLLDHLSTAAAGPCASAPSSSRCTPGRWACRAELLDSRHRPTAAGQGEVRDRGRRPVQQGPGQSWASPSRTWDRSATSSP